MEWLTKAIDVATAIATLIGIVVPVASLICSAINARIRSAVEHGYQVPRWLLVVTATANFTAFNFDKVPQMARGYRGRSQPPPPPIPLPKDQP